MSGPASAVYDEIGAGYAQMRRPDPRIRAAIVQGVGEPATVLNVGAGAGSYEPEGPGVVAVDLSARMLAQRPPSAAPAVRGSAMQLPFPDDHFDVGLAVLTIHHWADPRSGLEELARVSRRQVLLTFDPARDYHDFWLARDYLPDIATLDPMHHVPFAMLQEVLGPLDVRSVQIPHDCSDGFLCAYWRRPHAYLEPRVRRSISTFSILPDPAPGLEALRRDLEDGTWERRNAELLTREAMDWGYRVVVAGAPSA